MERLIVLITEEQHVYLNKICSELKISKSAYCRNLIRNNGVYVPEDVDEFKQKFLNKTYNRYISPSLRFDVFKRDRSTCKICGKSVENDPMCRLEIDHIYPISKGGLTNIDNLQTLCAECNLGKSNKI